MKNLITILCLCLFWFSCDSPTESEDLSYYDLYCSQGFVELWGIYYDIENTTELILNVSDGNWNILTGIIPPQIGCLENLTYISLEEMGLTGNIPSEIGNLTQLEYLGLRDNNFYGEIPKDVCDLIENNNLDIDDILDGNVDIINSCED